MFGPNEPKTADITLKVDIAEGSNLNIVSEGDLTLIVIKGKVDIKTVEKEAAGG
jgi:hypothetical protein